MFYMQTHKLCPTQVSLFFPPPLSLSLCPRDSDVATLALLCKALTLLLLSSLEHVRVSCFLLFVHSRGEWETFDVVGGLTRSIRQGPGSM